ncbi:hypothetical protein EV702DRAFT_1086070 [Suillus placidus]|uniref:Uncharacterized protein n=1 Tax=Suillus placidus TaxID=48579 RepID=A0A9P6ZZP5_9AGAM|nr:hypothetical protein EV702DRAFT_1086070 [Suillus placidus]
MISTSQRVSSRSASNESKFLPTKSAVSPSLSTLLALLHCWHLKIKCEAQVISIDFVPPVWRHGPFDHHSLEANIGKFPNHIFIFSAFVRSLTPRSLTAFSSLSITNIYQRSSGIMKLTRSLVLAPLPRLHSQSPRSPDASIQCRPFNWLLLDHRLHHGNQDHLLQLYPRRYIKDSVTGMSVNDLDLKLFGVRGQRIQ